MSAWVVFFNQKWSEWLKRRKLHIFFVDDENNYIKKLIFCQMSTWVVICNRKWSGWLKRRKLHIFFEEDENNYKKIKYFVKCQYESCFTIENGVEY